MSEIISKKSEPTRLNSLQISLLRLFEQDFDQNQTPELRRLLMDYFDGKLKAELEVVTAQKGYTGEAYRKMLNDDKYAIECFE